MTTLISSGCSLVADDNFDIIQLFAWGWWQLWYLLAICFWLMTTLIPSICSLLAGHCFDTQQQAWSTNKNAVACKLSKSDYSDPSPGRHAINRYFPRGVAKRALHSAKIPSTFLSDQQKILINCILKYFWRFTACKKSNSKQPLGEFRS